MSAKCFGMSLAIAGVIAMTSCGEPEAEKVRKSVLSGTWYEGTEAALRAQVDRYLDKVTLVEIPGRIVALVSPHAGYFYSGQAAAYAYAQLKGHSYSRVLILAPSHYVHFRGASVPEVTHYETPLGRVPLDLEACAKLLAFGGVSTVAAAHAQEHSLEIQIPFLQRTLGDFQLVPVVVGEIAGEDYLRFAKAIREVVDENTLVVASSDFTHFGPRFGYRPFRNDVKENLRTLDLGAVEHILKKDRSGFLRYKQETGATICGAAPIGLLLELLSEDAEGKLLNYYTSGDLTGDYENSVSYVSLVFFRSGENRSEEGALSREEQQTLLRLAREALEAFARTKSTPDVAEDDPRLTLRCKAERGVFVTLKKEGRLRGCIGYILPRTALYRAVIENAVNAGWRDPRFPPLAASEIPDLEIEISVLTVPRKVASPGEIVIGEHGVILEKGFQSAVYLPQVAPEQGWGVEETLTNLSLKAGLPADGWKEAAEFSVFRAQVFSEGE